MSSLPRSFPITIHFAHRTDLLISTLLVVDLVIPEQGLVSITPWVSLVADVEVVVLWALGRWWSMCLVFPVLVPQGVRIGAENDEAWDGDAVACQ